MDEAAIEAAGTAPLKPYLAKIGAISSRTDLVKTFAEPGIMSPIGVGILPDPADPTRYIAAAGQAGLGLPNRDYYLLEGEKYDAIRKAYRAYVVKMQQLAGIADAEAKADRIVALETALAKIHWEPARQRDIKQIYNPMNRAQLAELAPQFEWPVFLEAAGLGGVATVIAAEKSAITETGKMLDTVPLSTWKDYLAFHFVSSHANALAEGVRRGEFRILLEDAARRSPAARALEARRPDDQRLARRGGRPGLCRAPLSGGEQPPDGRADRQSARRPRGAPRRLDLDGRRDQGAGARQARRLRPANRPPGQVDRLFEPRG